jgi:hypothetical protein
MMTYKIGHFSLDQNGAVVKDCGMDFILHGLLIFKQIVGDAITYKTSICRPYLSLGGTVPMSPPARTSVESMPQSDI